MAKQALLKRWTFVKNKNKNKWVLELIPIISLSLLSFTFLKGLGYNYNSFQIKYLWGVWHYYYYVGFSQMSIFFHPP